jgi:magnesium chelatase subunit H
VEAAGTARPEVLDKLLATTERVVQEVDSVEYGISDIQEYYANTGGKVSNALPQLAVATPVSDFLSYSTEEGG